MSLNGKTILIVAILLFALAGGITAVVARSGPSTTAVDLVKLRNEGFARMPEPAMQSVSWAADVKPILEQHCSKCHNEKRKRGEFEYETEEKFLAGSRSGPVAVAGDSKNSLLIKVLVKFPGVPSMPQGKAEPVTPGEIAILRAWIDQGVRFD